MKNKTYTNLFLYLFEISNFFILTGSEKSFRVGKKN